jgi:CRISPR-associated protein Csd1
MLLQKLGEYYDRLEGTHLPPLYAEAPVRYIVELDGGGSLRSLRPIDTADPQERATARGVRRPVPQIQRASGTKPLLLADSAEYTFGLVREADKTARAAERHAAYLDILARCSAQTREPAVIAVQAFLQTNPLDQLDLPVDFDAGATLTFRVDDHLPIDLTSVQAFWAAEHDPAAKEGVTVLQCLVCGNERPVLDRLPGRIKGIPGGQSSGTSIISANSNAFESYGLEASLIAPTCASCAERFTRALNALLADSSSRMMVGNSVFVAWTREEVGFNLFDYVDQPKPDQVQALLEAVFTGRRTASIDETAFYACSLSASGGRAVVRDWIDTTVGDVKRQLAWWFQIQRIVGGSGEPPEPVRLYALAASTVRELRDLPVTVPRVLVHAALTGSTLPSGLLAQAIRRNTAEQRVTRPRAALIKAVLLSRQPEVKEDRLVQLDVNHPDPAYHCGRLLAVLDATQRTALPGINVSVADRFFGTASSAPLSVFPRLIKGATFHLAKLRRDRPGAYRALQARLEDTQAHLRQFPRILTLDQQGLFALGYYHQRAHDRAAAREAIERRKSGTPQLQDTGIAELDMDESNAQ